MFGPSEGAWSGSGWVSMKTPGDPDRHGRARQNRDELALPAGRRPLPARLLHRMGGVENHRRAGLAGHDRQRAHVGDEGVVAEADAPLGDEHVGRTGRVELRDHVLHVPGRKKLPLLDVDRSARARRGNQQVGLAAKESGDLQRVDGLGDRSALGALVHVGDHRQAEAFADVGEHRQRRREPQPPRARARGAVRLVEGRLVDEPDLSRAAISFSACAVSSAWARLSIWQGPAISASGRSTPNLAASGPRPT